MSTHVFKISLCYDKNWEISYVSQLISIVDFSKLGMSTHVFKISLCYDKKWEIKLCISINIYRRLLKLGMSTNVKLPYAMIKKGKKSYVSFLKQLMGSIQVRDVFWIQS